VIERNGARKVKDRGSKLIKGRKEEKVNEMPTC
jgi:hypothetical protein